MYASRFATEPKIIEALINGGSDVMAHKSDSWCYLFSGVHRLVQGFAQSYYLWSWYTPNLPQLIPVIY